jgi:hypothetical protein
MGKRFNNHFGLGPKLFRYHEGGEFDGILSNLSRECGGNVHEKGIINITASSTALNNCWQVADHGWDDRWISNNSPHSWICFDFKDKCVSVTHYTLKSHNGNLNFPVQWEIEGSNDGSAWKSLDSRNTKELAASGRARTFECCNANSDEFFHLIRMRQTGVTSHNSNYLIFSTLEFFGWMKRNEI